MKSHFQCIVDIMMTAEIALIPRLSRPTCSFPYR